MYVRLIGNFSIKRYFNLFGDLFKLDYDLMNFVNVPVCLKSIA